MARNCDDDWYNAQPLYGGQGSPLAHVEGDKKLPLGLLASHRRSQAKRTEERRTKAAGISPKRGR